MNIQDLVNNHMTSGDFFIMENMVERAKGMNLKQASLYYNVSPDSLILDPLGRSFIPYKFLRMIEDRVERNLNMDFSEKQKKHGDRYSAGVFRMCKGMSKDHTTMFMSKSGLPPADKMYLIKDRGDKYNNSGSFFLPDYCFAGLQELSAWENGRLEVVKGV